jgi:hypothetical protein
MQHWEQTQNNSHIGCLSVQILHQVETMMIANNFYILFETATGRTKVVLWELLSYEGYSDQWEVNDFTLVAFVERSCWRRVRKPENGTSLLWQHLNILQDKKNNDQPITTNANDNWYNRKFNKSLTW